MTDIPFNVCFRQTSLEKWYVVVEQIVIPGKRWLSHDFLVRCASVADPGV